jgi:hypothetical protein
LLTGLASPLWQNATGADTVHRGGKMASDFFCDGARQEENMQSMILVYHQKGVDRVLYIVILRFINNIQVQTALKEDL